MITSLRIKNFKCWNDAGLLRDRVGGGLVSQAGVGKRLGRAFFESCAQIRGCVGW